MVYKKLVVGCLAQIFPISSYLLCASNSKRRPEILNFYSPAQFTLGQYSPPSPVQVLAHAL